jgi:uncharacterized protein (DUF697 family)
MLAQESTASSAAQKLRSSGTAYTRESMARIEKRGWVRRRLEDAIRSAFMKAYQTIKVDPDSYLEHLRMAYDLPALTYEGVYSVDAEILDHVAVQTIRVSMRIGAAAGAGLGMGGMFTMLPDLGILAAITLRMLQKLSLIYGFPYNTEEEEAELWVAAASAAGVDISRELLEKQFVSKFVPRVIQRIAVTASGEIVEKWTARLIPVISSVIGAGLNYYFVKVWGERAIGHFRQKHLQIRHQRLNNRIKSPAVPAS